MKPKLILLLFIISLQSNFVFSQKEDSVIAKKDSVLRMMLIDQCYCDSPSKCPTGNKSKYFYTGRQYITNYSMNRLIRRDITKITSDEEGLPVLGNYASVKMSDDDSKITFNASIYNPLSKHDTLDNYPLRSILSVNVKAAISDGVSSLFTNSQINNEAGIKLKWSFLSKKTLYVNDSSIDCNQMKLYRERLYYDLRDNRTRFLVDSSVYKEKLIEYQKEVPLMNAAALSLENKRDSLRSLPEPSDSSKNAELKSLIKVTSHQADSARLKHLDALKEFSEFQSKKPIYDRSKVLDQFYSRLLEVETANVKWHRFKIQWWDFDAGFDGFKYNLYNKNVSLDSQLTKKKFSQFAFGVSFNSFSSRINIPFLRHGVFIKLSYQMANDNTLTGATTKEIRTTALIDSPGVRREVISKVDAYDIPFSKLYSHTFKGQFTKYLNEKKTSGLSLYSTCVLAYTAFKNPFAIDGKPDLSAGMGYLIGFLDKEKEKNIINVELFLNFNDIANSADEKDSNFFKRYQFGLKFGVPFNSIFLNQK